MKNEITNLALLEEQRIAYYIRHCELSFKGLQELREVLEDRERKDFSPLFENYKKLPDLLKLFCLVQGYDSSIVGKYALKRNHFRQLFIYAMIRFYARKYFIVKGYRLPYGFAKAVGEVLKIPRPQVSDMTKKVKVRYSVYEDFKREADIIFKAMLGALKM
jgi:hypothetical protein